MADDDDMTTEEFIDKMSNLTPAELVEGIDGLVEEVESHIETAADLDELTAGMYVLAKAVKYLLAKDQA